MSPHTHPSDSDEMRPEYDFSQGVRGKHYQVHRAGTNVVFLEPDVAAMFPDSASVNHALRLVLITGMKIHFSVDAIDVLP